MNTGSTDTSMDINTLDTDPLITNTNPIKRVFHRLYTKTRLVVLLTGIAVSATTIAVAVHFLAPNSNASNAPVQHTTKFGNINQVSYALHDTITHNNLYSRLTDLQAIADLSIPTYNHTTRVIGSVGFDKTIEYIHNEVAQYSDYYDVTTQVFPVNYYKHDTAAMTLNFAANTVQMREHVDYRVMKMSANSDLTASLFVVANNGCIAADYTATPTNKAGDVSVELPIGDLGMAAQQRGSAGHIAVVKRGLCTFEQKIDLATAAGAVGAVIYNHGGDEEHKDLFGGDISAMKLIPTFAVTYDIGKLLLSSMPTVSLQCSGTMREIQVTNVIADSKAGDAHNTIVASAHSDSVEAGPGINDDGTGSMALLEIATQMANSRISVVNKVRYLWAGAEEEGLLGSLYYTDQLGLDERHDIIAAFNYDMLGGDNGKYAITDGTTESTDGTVYSDTTVVAAKTLKQLLSDYFAARGVPSEFEGMDGRSDYAGFANADIPISGIETGAEQWKSIEERKSYGGLAGTQYDTCYHQLCDSIENVDMNMYVTVTQAIAYVMENLAVQPNVREFLQTAYIGFNPATAIPREAIQNPVPPCENKWQC